MNLLARLSRCVVCKARIWPWQSKGFYVQSGGTRYWHTSCARQWIRGRHL